MISNEKTKKLETDLKHLCEFLFQTQLIFKTVLAPLKASNNLIYFLLFNSFGSTNEAYRVFYDVIKFFFRERRCRQN